MSTVSTFGISFGGDALQPRPATARQKAENMTRMEEARLAALDPRVRGWSDRHDVNDLEAMNEVVRAYRGEGYAPVRIHLPDLARSLKTDEADASARLERLVKSGAVERIKRIANSPTFRPNSRGDAPAVTVTGRKGEVRTFAPAAPGSLLGLRRRA
jgi:hypothetical protein